MSETIIRVAAQNSGNPVLDSLVNLYVARGGFSVKDMQETHAVLLELAAKEPGGLKRAASCQNHEPTS